MSVKPKKFRIVAELQEIREFKKQYNDNPDMVIRDIDVKTRWASYFLYYGTIEELRDFWDKLCDVIATENKRLETLEEDK